MGVKQRSPTTEVFILKSKLVLLVVEAVDWDLLLVPVNNHRASGSEAAGQDAVFINQAGHIDIREYHCQGGALFIGKCQYEGWPSL